MSEEVEVPTAPSEAVTLAVGQRFSVPCLLLTGAARDNPHAHIASDGQSYLPVFLPLHTDEEVGFPYWHYHIDLRFATIPSALYHERWGAIVMSDFEKPGNRRGTSEEFFKNGIHYLNFASKHGGILPMPPVNAQTRGFLSGIADGVYKSWADMEKNVGCHKLKPGNICPHKGINLNGFDQGDGTAICPGHGLRWNLSTGEQIPRHSIPAPRF